MPAGAAFSVISTTSVVVWSFAPITSPFSSVAIWKPWIFANSFTEASFSRIVPCMNAGSILPAKVESSPGTSFEAQMRSFICMPITVIVAS